MWIRGQTLYSQTGIPISRVYVDKRTDTILPDWYSYEKKFITI